MGKGLCGGWMGSMIMLNYVVLALVYLFVYFFFFFFFFFFG